MKRRNICPDCGSDNLSFDPESEQLHCNDCGSVFDEFEAEKRKRYEEASD